MPIRQRWLYAGLVVLVAAVTFGVAALLVNIMQRKQ